MRRQPLQGPGHRRLHGAAAGQAVDGDGEGAGREAGGRGAVRLGGALHGEPVDELRLPADEQAEGGRADEGAGVAGLRVLGLVGGARVLVAEAGEAGAGRVAAGVEPLLVGEPAIVLAALVGAPVALGGGPAQMGPVDVGGRVPGAGVAADLGADQAVDGEEGHLGGGGDGAPAPERGDGSGESVRSVGLAQFRQGGPAGARPQRVAERPAEQTAPHPGPEVLLLGTAPHGCGCRGHDVPSPGRRFAVGSLAAL